MLSAAISMMAVISVLFLVSLTLYLYKRNIDVNRDHLVIAAKAAFLCALSSVLLAFSVRHLVK